MPRIPFIAATALAATCSWAQSEGTCVATGGKPALDKLFEQELQYPPAALEAGIKGEVVVAARLSPAGDVRQLSIGRSLSPECDEEALRLVGLVKWKPATAGEACAGREFFLAVPFDPGRYKRWLKDRVKHAGAVFELPADTGSEVHSAKALDRLVEPEIPNGMAGLPAYISREMRYPAEAFRYSLDGTVRMEFIVEPSGAITNMHPLQEVGGGCTEEAMRLLYRIAWRPGARNGQRVRSVLQVSIRFDLPKQMR